MAYVETLKAEIALLRRHLPRGVTLSAGCTGAAARRRCCRADLIRGLADAVFAVAPMAADGEFSVEIDPNEIDDARLDALAAAGMNRASIGVQDFDPLIQKAIGREQSYRADPRCGRRIRERGVASLNADILYGLPFQTGPRIADSVQKLLTLSPDRVALYGYAHVPWMSRRQQMIPSDAMPTPEERLSLFETARQLFLWDGYVEVGIDHFAKPEDGMARALKAGTLRRNFQGYTDDTAPVADRAGGLVDQPVSAGVCAECFGHGGAYQGDPRGAVLDPSRAIVFAGEDLLRARIIEALMCDFCVSRAGVVARVRRHARPDRRPVPAAAAEFGDMVRVSDEGFLIPERARPLTRMIARAFDAYDTPRRSIRRRSEGAKFSKSCAESFEGSWISSRASRVSKLDLLRQADRPQVIAFARHASGGLAHCEHRLRAGPARRSGPPTSP